MRIAVWNMERGGRGARGVEQQLQLLGATDFDVAIVTEPSATCSGADDGTVSSPALREGRSALQAWVAVLGEGVEPLHPALAYERLAVAAQVRMADQPVIVYGSVLPWRAARLHVPDLALPGESAGAMFARYLDHRQVADIEQLQRTYPEAVVLWAGDFNQSLEGPNLVGSAQGRALLEEALGRLGLVAWNRTAGHAKDGLCAIDLVCGPRACTLRNVERFEPELEGRPLSEHAGYVVDVELNVELRG